MKPLMHHRQGLRMATLSALAGSLFAIAVQAECVPAPAQLVAWWRGENDAQDSFGGNQGTLQNGAAFNAGKVGQAFHFDGINDYASIANTAAMDFGTGDFTIVLWVNFDSLVGDQTFLDKLVGNFPASKEYFFEFNIPNSLRFVVRDTTGNQNDLGVATALQVGTWYHLAAVRHGNTNAIYLDGVLKGQQTAGAGVDTGAGGTAVIGRLAENADRFLAGSLDEIALFNRALGAAEIQSIFQAGSDGMCFRRISWFKVAGGGGTSTDGTRTLRGTIGQPDAGGPLTNSQYSVVGGFWALPVAVQVTGAPTLTIVPASPGSATISWTPNTPGFVLQETLSLSPTNWVYSPSGSTNPITVPAALPAKFYRLTKP